MLVIKNDEYSEKWITFADDEKYLIRYTSQQKITEIADSTNNLIEQDVTLFDHIIKDWQGVLNEKNEKLECNKDNKILLISHFADRRNFLLKSSVQASTFTGTQDDIEKN